MGKIFNSLTELIGHTPLLEVKGIEREKNLFARLLVKIESFNPGGSIKDRVAYAMIVEAEKSGELRPGGTIIEPTSGNTGIGLAWVGRSRGYDVILTMPETMSKERQSILNALGARLVLTPGKDGMKGAIEEAERLRDQNPGSIIMQQFENPANPLAHELTTAKEIWEDTDGGIDMLVAGVGTGGTISGTGRGLKERKTEITVVAVEPSSSAVLEGKPAGPHKIQGIGAGFVPRNYDGSVVDEIVPVTDQEAMEASRLLAKLEGLLVGISSGAALSVGMRLAGKPENEGKTIVVILPDTGDRYLSTELFNQ